MPDFESPLICGRIRFFPLTFQWQSCRKKTKKPIEFEEKGAESTPSQGQGV